MTRPGRGRTLRSRRLAPSTRAGRYVHEEIRHVRRGKHGAKSPAPAIDIGLSKARRAGVRVPPRKGAPKRRAR
jgi:hypothetical protein